LDKILIEIYDCYGSSAEVTKKATSFVIESMDELGEALEDENYEWLAEIGDMDYGDFANGNVETVIIDYTGDWDDPIAYKLVRYSYEEKLNQIQATYQKEQEELNKLFNI
jgi:hypothetical protein